MSRDIDARVAREVMGLEEGKPCGLHNCCLMHRLHPCEGCGRIAGQSKPYSTDMNAAMEVVAVVRGAWDKFELHYETGRWFAIFSRPGMDERIAAGADTPALAICLAALEAVKL